MKFRSAWKVIFKFTLISDLNMNYIIYVFFILCIITIKYQSGCIAVKSNRQTDLNEIKNDDLHKRNVRAYYELKEKEFCHLETHTIYYNFHGCPHKVPITTNICTGLCESSETLKLISNSKSTNCQKCTFYSFNRTKLEINCGDKTRHVEHVILTGCTCFKSSV